MSLENIISKYLLNKSDQQELEQLKAWQAEAQDNVAALEEMQQIFTLDMSDYKSYNTESAWDSIESQITEADDKQDANKESGNKEEPEKNDTAQIFQIKRWIMSAAAAIVFLAATTAVWYKYTDDSYPMHYAATDMLRSADLPDASIVNLDRGTTLDIISSDFDKNRALQLNGRAYFTVTKDADHPFTVALPQGKVTVLGTQFNINTEENLEEIYVKEGHVRYDISNRSFDLRAGDYIKVIDGDVIKVAMNDDNYLSWKSGKLILDNVNLTKAVKNLSTHFKTDISLLPTLDALDCKISTTIEQESLTEALEELSILLSLQYKKVENKILITDIKC